MGVSCSKPLGRVSCWSVMDADFRDSLEVLYEDILDVDRVYFVLVWVWLGFFLV